MEKQHAPESLRSQRIGRAVEISAEMFLKNGIEAVKMTDIADACGVGVATLYRYFGTKTIITIAAMTHLWTRLRGMYEHVFETEVFFVLPALYSIPAYEQYLWNLVLYNHHQDLPL